MSDKPMVDKQGYIDVRSALKLREAEGRVDVEKLQAESDAKFRELMIKESAKEVAAKHLAKFAGFYLTFLVMAFIFSIKFIPSESIAVVAGLITLVVTNLSMILKNIVETDNGEHKEDTTLNPDKGMKK
jgi:uncharacterized membrane protein